MVKIKNYDQLKAFTNGKHYIEDEDHLKSVKRISLYPYLVFDFDKLPNDKRSETTIVFNLKEEDGFHEYGLKGTLPKNIRNNDYDNLINLIRNQNPKAKKKAKEKLKQRSNI